MLTEQVGPHKEACLLEASRFNVAAAVQPRKVVSARVRPLPDSSFSVAATVQPRKAAMQRLTWPRCVPLQCGRDCSAAEGWASRSSGVDTSSLHGARHRSGQRSDPRVAPSAVLVRNLHPAIA